MENLEKELTRIYEAILAGESVATDLADNVHPSYYQSAKNLYRYLILRTFDLRSVHDRLSEYGISAMRTAEGYVLKNIVNSLSIIQLLQGKETLIDAAQYPLNHKKAKKVLKKHANQLFNTNHKKHTTEIMVTMPTEISENELLAEQLILAGMEVARINLSHDNPSIWEKMVVNLRNASIKLKQPIKIYMDLSGPKIRTSEIKITKKGKEQDFIRLHKGEHLILTSRDTKGKNAKYKDGKQLVRNAEVGLLLPQIVEDLQIGDPVYFDDGMIEGRVIGKSTEEIELLITKTHKNKLKGRKGINLPETQLRLPSLTRDDIANLPFVIQHADIVGYSFVRTPKDIQLLYRELERLGNPDIGVVLKIENKEAFENLSLLLFEAMKRPKIGVMIARGDLAVELGYERIAEVQQQILWFCEAAHIPTIWATQVLENLAKKGMATRAEVSDASLSAQAECVMLNKGPHIVEAVKLLKNILIRLEKHYSKKKPSMRALNVAKLKLAKLNTLFQNKQILCSSTPES